MRFEFWANFWLRIITFIWIDFLIALHIWVEHYYQLWDWWYADEGKMYDIMDILVEFFTIKDNIWQITVMMYNQPIVVFLLGCWMILALLPICGLICYVCLVPLVRYTPQKKMEDLIRHISWKRTERRIKN